MAFNEQFEVLATDAVIWEPYADDERDRRYPGGISIMCTRDYAYWMTKSKIIFDVFVEEMAQQRVMRQFGRRHMVVPLPSDDPLPPLVHKYVYVYALHNCPYLFITYFSNTHMHF